MARKEIRSKSASKPVASTPDNVGTGKRPRGNDESSGGGEPVRTLPPTPIVAIGSSAGGLEALQEFFSAVPADSGIAFVVLTHVRPGRDTMLPELLGAVTRMPVAHAGESTKLEPNRVVVARDSLIDVSRGVMMPMRPSDIQESIYHPIDHFFRSLAQDQKEHAIGVILSGSGNDGALGLRAIKAAGGMIMVQSPDTAKYTGMPDSAIATHLADYILAPADMSPALIEYCRGPYLQLVRRSEEPLLPEVVVQTILLRLEAHSGQDFTCYKRSTISRRIQRRMTVHRIDDPQEYVGFLRDNPREMEALMEELLISVTSFFRDPPAWQALTDALATLLRERDEGYPLRVWVPGCATGEEAYSAAIVTHELFRKLARGYSVQIFATDLDERAIDVARAGVYPESISGDVSEERLNAFFSHEDGAYRVIKPVRDSIVFAMQNVISDPPFTRLDLIICRNVLIYLDANAHRHVLPNFHYALRSGGLLFLGSAESVGESGHLFESVNPKHKILRRREVSRPVTSLLPGGPRRRVGPPGPEAGDHATRTQQQMSRQVMQLLLDRYVPCSVLVDDRGTVVHVQGRSGIFLEPEQGPPRNNIVEMAREGLGPTLAAAMRQARHEKREIVRDGIPVRSNGGHILVDISVLPLAQPDSLRGHLLLTMRNREPSAPGEERGEAPAISVADSLELERELQSMSDNLQTTIEELETSNEELKSSNEELQSTNEELQSSNEELETSKEEMQSLNEELNTVNSELQAKVDALARTNDDMNNLLNSMQVATIFLDTHLRVKRYTEQARDVVRLISSDIGRPLSDLTSSLVYPSLIADCERVLSRLVPLETEVRNSDGRWYLVRLIPYRTADNVIEGLVMTIIDVDRSKQAEDTLRRMLDGGNATERVLSTILEDIPAGIVVADQPGVTIRAVSRYLREITGRRAETLVGLPLERHVEGFNIYRADGVTRPRPEELPLSRAAVEGETVRDEVMVIARRDGTKIPFLCTAAPIRGADGAITGALAQWVEISELKQREEEELRRRETP